jgi:hypothetical protein
MNSVRKLLYKAFGVLGGGEVRAYEKATLSVRSAQEQLLLGILRKNMQSVFGREHRFSSINNVAEFQKCVPIRDYEQFRPYIDRATNGEKSILTSVDPFMYATTSGTTGNQKFIPITADYMQEFRRASVVSGYHLLRTFPQLDEGVTLSMLSPAVEGHTPGGTAYGAISGQLFMKEPALIKKFISPMPYDVYLLKDYESRYYTILRLALVMPLSCMYTLNPSTIRLLSKKLVEYAPQLIKDVGAGTITPPVDLPGSCRKAIAGLLKPQPQRAAELQSLLSSEQFVPHKLWPKLQVVSCWTKAAAAFYLSDFPRLFRDVPVCDISYGASEGRGTVFLSPSEQALAIRSHFFEFVPEDEIGNKHPTVLLADELQAGKNYYILFTTSGGLYRYNINDIVKVVGFHNQVPLLEFQCKGSNMFSFTGEKLSELQVTQAMSRTLAAQKSGAAFFTLMPKFDPEPHYQLWIEGSTEIKLSTLCKSLDQHLKVLNVEYAAKRQSQRLGEITAQEIQPGTYESLRKHLTASGTPDSQIKVSHLNPKSEIRQFLEDRLLQPMLTS